VSRLAVLFLAVSVSALSNLSGLGLSIASPEPKLVAVTMDDLPLNGSRIDIDRLQTMTRRILAGIRTYHVPVVGFVNESLLYVPGETDERIALLKAWTEAGVELGNHTFSHVGFRDVSLAGYEDDFMRGDALSGMLMKEKGRRIRYFRHPYLQMGASLELEKSFESFIAERGYQIAPVSIDTMDWMFLAAYSKALTIRDPAMIKRVSEEYLTYVRLKFDFCETAAGDLFGHGIRHILLLHANELNADNIDGLLKMMKGRGYQFITLEEALKDPVYQYPEKYQATSDWLALWAFSKGRSFASPMPPEFIQKMYADTQKKS
jgi:peptidoglycan/xylan/chitin deacetylase (PgdA/CDA1 family)